MRTKKSKPRVILLLVMIMMIECLVGIGIISVCLLVMMAHYEIYKAHREKRLREMYLSWEDNDDNHRNV